MTSEELKELQSKMPNDILIEKVEHQISELAMTGGRSHVMCVPPEITDTDMLLSEMVRRFIQLEAERKEMIEENLKLKTFWEWFSGKYNRFKCFGFKSTKDRDAYEQKYNELVKPIYLENLNKLKQ